MSDKRQKLTAEHAARLVKVLMTTPMSADQITEMTGLKKATVQRWLRIQRESGAMRVAGYLPDARGRLFTPQFAWGLGVDAPRPGKLRSAADRMRDLRQRRREEREREA